MSCPICGAQGQTDLSAMDGSHNSAQVSGERAALAGETVRAAPGQGSAGSTDFQLDTLHASQPAAGATAAAMRGRYTILHLHARGGLGNVNLARDEDLHRIVALKEIRSDWLGDADSHARFLSEAEITGQLEHPGVVPVYCLGRDEQGHPYYAMRFVHGRTLAQSIAEYHADPEPLGFRGLLRRFVDVCQAVAYAHSRSVIHRDLKPANIMLGDYGETLVLDWGLAKRVGRAGEMVRSCGHDETTPAASLTTSPPHHPTTSPPRDLTTSRPDNLTEAGAVLGTPAYMSPEQAGGRAEEVGPAADIYALGAILYEMLAGRLPHEGRTTAEVLGHVLFAHIEPPSQVNRGVPKPLEAICLKAMARAPENRYATAAELAGEIERWLADEPVAAYREPPLQRALRWSRRHKALVAGLSALFITSLVLVITFLGVHNVLIGQEQQRTEHARGRAETNFKKARAAVDQMLTRVGEERLANIPLMDRVRRELLEEALAFYQQFLEDQGDDPDTRLELALAHRRIGDINLMLGKHREGADAYGTAISSLERLVQDFPDNVEFRHQLAWCHHELGWLLFGIGDTQRAETAYRQALQLEEPLAAKFSDRLDYRQRLARTHHNLGLLLHRTDRHADAEPHFQRVLALRTELVAASSRLDYRRELAEFHNDFGLFLRETNRLELAEESLREARRLQDEVVSQTVLAASEGVRQGGSDLSRARAKLPDYQRELAAILSNLGLVLMERARFDDAEAAYRQARLLGEKLIADFPTRPDYRLELARCCLNLGNLLFGRQRTADAGNTWQQALTHFQRLVSDLPEVPDYQSELALTLNNLAALDASREDWPEVRRRLEEAVAHQAQARAVNPRHPLYRQRLRDHYAGLADTLLKLKDHASAAAAARELAQIYPEGWDGHYRSAAFLARCVPLAEQDADLPDDRRRAEAEKYAAEALAALRTAISNGLRDVKKLDDPAFDAVRARQEFRALSQAIQP